MSQSAARHRLWWILGSAALLALVAGSTLWYAVLRDAPSPQVPTSTAPCLDAKGFEEIASRLASGIFEGSQVTVRVRDDKVTCATGWALAQVTYAYGDASGRDGWIVLRYVDDQWQWTVDDYWRQFGETEQLCARLPDALRSSVGCAPPSPSIVPADTCGDGSPGGPGTLAEALAADWVGVCVPGDFCAITDPVRLAATAMPATSQQWGEAYVSAVGDDNRGDVDGDGRDEVALELDCHNGGGTAAGRLARAYAIFAGGPGGRLSLLGMITAQKQEPDQMPTLFSSIKLAHGTVTVQESWYRPSDMTCCPTGKATTVWTLSDGELRAGAPDVTG